MRLFDCDFCGGFGEEEDGMPCVPCAGTGALCVDCDLPRDECKCEVATDS